jgi:hypothetical protein
MAKRTPLQPNQQLYASRALRLARKAAGFASASAAAEQLGFTNAKYRAQEAGSRSISLEDAKRYAAAFAVPLRALLEDQSPSFNQTRTVAQHREAVAKSMAERSKLAASRRLKIARVARGFDSGLQASQAVGVPSPTYLGHEAGKSALATPIVRLYAAFFDISETWLRHGGTPSGLGPELDERLSQIGEPDDVVDFRHLVSAYRPASKSRIAALTAALQASKAPSWTKEAGDILREVKASRLKNFGPDAIFSKPTGFWPLPKGFARSAFGVSVDEIVVVIDDDTRERLFLNTSDTLLGQEGEFLVLHRNQLLEFTHIREEALIMQACAGMIYACGGGTVREIFEDGEQNFYAKSTADFTPMIFFDADGFWERDAEFDARGVARPGLNARDIVEKLFRYGRRDGAHCGAEISWKFRGLRTTPRIAKSQMCAFRSPP